MGPGKLTKHGKKLLAQSMYAKGRAFLGAAILVKRCSRDEATESVALHLLCQGIEVTLKGLLLLANYDAQAAKLKNRYGHNLTKVAKAAASEYGLNPLSKDLVSELEALNEMYSAHRLRYGTIGDIFINPRSLSRRLVTRRISAVVKLADRKARQGAI